MEAMSGNPLDEDIEGIVNEEIVNIFNQLEGAEDKGLTEAEIKKKFPLR